VWQVFDFDVSHIHWPTYLENYCIGVKRFALNEDMSRLPEARRSVNRYVVLLLHFVLVLCLKTKKANTHLAASYRTAHVDSRLVLEKVKPFLILVTFYGSSISWSMCKQSASCCRQDNHASLASLAFYGLDAGPTNIINALKASN